MSSLFNKNNTAGTLRLLIIDGNKADQVAIRHSMNKINLNVRIYTSLSGKEGLQLLEREHFDCIFIDFRLPDMDGLELMEKISQIGIAAPVLIITSQDDERIVAQAIQLGASDYLPKSLLTPERIYHTVRNAIRLKQIERERSLTEERLRTSQAQLDFLISNTPTAFWSIDAKGNFNYANGLGFELIGINPANVTGKNFYEIYRPYPRIISRFERALSGEVVQSVDETNSHFFKSYYVPTYDSTGRITGVTGFAIDITERIRSERELIKAKEVAENAVRVK